MLSSADRKPFTVLVKRGHIVTCILDLYNGSTRSKTKNVSTRRASGPKRHGAASSALLKLIMNMTFDCVYSLATKPALLPAADTHWLEIATGEVQG